MSQSAPLQIAPIGVTPHAIKPCCVEKEGATKQTTPPTKAAAPLAKEHYVFAPGFCGGTTDDIETACLLGGIPKQAMTSLPSAYPCPADLHQRATNSKGASSNQTLGLWGKLCKGATSVVHKLVSIKDSLLQYFRFHNPQSKSAQAYAKRIHDQFTQKGFSAEKPAEITMVAHSGGIAPAIAMARQPLGKHAFKVTEIVSYGSPVTPKLLKELPPNVRLRYVMSNGDTLHHTINMASKLVYAITGNELVSWDIKKHHPNSSVIITSKPVGHKEYGKLPANEVENHVEPDN